MRRKYGGEEYTETGFSYPVYVDFRDHVPGFSSVGMYTYPNAISLGLGPDARKVTGILVSGTYFGTLGTRMLLGRDIAPNDDVPPDGSRVVVISYGMWQREVAGKTNVLGQQITLAKRQFTVIGVAPKGFVGTGTKAIDVWIPVTAAEGLRFAGTTWASDRTTSWLSVVGRAKPVSQRPHLQRK
jgi:hypothetical protein